MSRRRQMLVAMILGTLGILGLAVAAIGQTAGAQQQYQAKLKTLDPDKVDDLYGLAKWCYQNGLTGEAMAHATEALKKDPADARAKFLIYLLTGSFGGEGGEGVVEEFRGRKSVSISEADAEAIFLEEGAGVLTRFREVLSLLSRRCGSTNCHGGQEAKAKWSLVLAGPVNRRVLAENFKTIYPYLDRDNPEQSRLLAMPMKGPDEGHPTQAVRGTTDPLFHRVSTWIDLVKTDTEKIFAK